MRIAKNGRGGLLRSGNPGNRGGKKGRSGRPKSLVEFELACAGCVSDDEVLRVASAIATNGEHAAWLGAVKWLADRGYGKAKEKIEVGTTKGAKVSVVIIGGREVKYA